MNLKSIRWRLPLSYAVIALLAALVLGSVMLLVLNSYYSTLERQYLFGNAEAVRSAVEQIQQANLPEQALTDQVKGLAFLSETQIKVFDQFGKTIVEFGRAGCQADGCCFRGIGRAGNPQRTGGDHPGWHNGCPIPPGDPAGGRLTARRDRYLYSGELLPLWVWVCGNRRNFPAGVRHRWSACR